MSNYYNEDNFKDNITRAILAKDCLGHQAKMVDKITDDIWWAWENWENSQTEEFHKGQDKPDIPTDDFVIDWVENMDFSTDGYDEEFLIELF